jgi:uncharacterized protein DUF6282
MMEFMRTLALLCIALSLPAQTLDGVIDIHAHCDPDSSARSIDAIDLARLAHQRGMRGLVLKNHFEPTASLAYVVRKIVPGIEAFGGIDLNRTVGGINPAAVEHMTRVKGGWGRVVWMPTFDAENQVRDSKENRPFVAVSRNGQLLPEVRETIALIARHHLVLATGHSSPAECLMLLREGRRAGVGHMVVTHAMKPPIRMNVGEMKQAAAEGAFLEFDYSALIGAGKMFEISQYTAAMRAVGLAHCIISSDLGQAGNPLHPDGLAAFFQALREQGLSIHEIEIMAKKNPAALLGLH